jgi:CMP-N-acetylneuraminic acid synthetase
MMKNIVAIVAVRGGSQRVKNKNNRPFAGKTLLDIKLETLKKIDNIDNIIVSSDCDELLSIAKKHGIETHRREEYYASSQCTNSEFFEHLGTILHDYDSIMYSPVTCPLISVNTYNIMLSQFQKYENLVTTSLVKQHLWLDGKPLNYDIKNSPNTQNLPDVMSITYGVSLIDRELMLECRNVVSHNPNFHVLSEIESIDIDTPLDFEFAEYLYENKKKIGLLYNERV